MGEIDFEEAYRQYGIMKEEQMARLAEEVARTPPRKGGMSLKWKIIGSLLVAALTVGTMLAGLINSGIYYRQMKAIETISERCGK